MVEMEGMIANHIVSILIVPGSNLSYVSPKIVEKFKLPQVKHDKPWMVHIATRTKGKVIEVIATCQFIMNGMYTQETLNILPLGYCDMLIHMNWLDSHKATLENYNKTLDYEDEEGKRRNLQGIKNPISVRQISSLKMKNYCKKGCPFYEIQVLNSVEDHKPILEDHPILRE